jgi:MFS family permease
MRGGVGGVWRRSNFRRLWGAQSVSALGTEVSELALPTLAILALGAEPMQVGALVALPWLAFLIAGLPAGVLVDRLPRGPLLIAADLGRLLALGAIPLSWFLDLLDLRLLFVCTALVGLLTVLYQVGYRSYLPELVGQAELLSGNAALTLGQGAAKVAGPSLAGVLIQVVGAPLALLADAVSYGLSALWLARIRVAPGPRRSPASHGEVVAEMGEGLRFVLDHPTIRPILAVNTLGNLGTGIVDGVALLYAYWTLRLDPGAVGLAMAVGSVGFVVVAATTGRLTRRLGVGRTLAWSSVVYAFAPLALALGALGHPFAAVTAWRLLLGISLPPYDVNADTIRQVATPDRLQGRAIAAINTIGWGALGLGPLLGGFLVVRVGFLPTILVGAAACFLACGPAFAPSLRRLERPPAGPLATATARAD